MKPLKFEALPFIIDVVENIHYQYDGAVNGLNTYTNQLCHSYGRESVFTLMECLFDYLPKPIRRTMAHKGKPVGYGARMFVHSLEKTDLEQALKQGGDVVFHIFTEKGMPKQEATYAIGHEETHLLQFINREYMLAEYLRMNNVNADTYFTLGKETRADIGGITAALSKHNGRLNQLSVHRPEAVEWLHENSNILFTNHLPSR